MAFATIPTALIQVGKAIKKELWDYVKDDLDDHEDRLDDVEALVNIVEVFNGNFHSTFKSSQLTGLMVWEVPLAFTIKTAYIQIFDAVTAIGAGTIELDVKKATSINGSYSSIFSTKPSINLATASDYDKSTNAVFNTGQVCAAGEYLKFDFTSLPTGGALTKLRIVVTGEI